MYSEQKLSTFYFLLLIFGANALYASEEFPYKHPSEIRISFKDYYHKNNQKLVYKIISSDIEGEAILQSASLNEAKTIIDREIFNVKSTFKSMTAPYAGQITSVVLCDSEKFVKENKKTFKGNEAKYVTAVATGRRIFGSCQLEEIENASVTWGSYDQSRKQVLIIKLFKQIKDKKLIIESQQSLLNFLWKIVNQ